MSKKKIPKASKKRLIVFGIPSIIIIFVFIIQLGLNVYHIYNLNIEKQKLEKQYTSLKRDEKELKTEIDKLQDDDYIARYARETYAYTKNGEYVLKLKEEEKKEEDNKFKLDINLDYQDIIIIIGILLFLIIIHSIKKSKKANEK